ncbi:MupA/Atu3671 family FMN-dependent luciferase-like monooxygenase [Herbaspirillum sp. GCM10030257]|uniref:LLM class flavin-dependent oxidoreductase n=1 Tax=Herbaspirillum sp. GCM10030257 TaxID=3273393 RepID=UPI0036119FAF
MIEDSIPAALDAREERFPLTSAQREVWFDQVMHADVPLYNIGGYMRIEGELDRGRFTQAFNLLLQKHDALRLVLVRPDDTNGEPQQTFPRGLRFEVPLHDFSKLPDAHAAAERWVQESLDQPFQLYGQRLFRCDLIKISDALCYWAMHFHHLVTDGWGIAMLGHSMAAIYDALESGQEPDLSVPQYTGYVSSDREYLRSDAYHRQRTYWLSKFEDVPEALFTPRHRTGEAVQGRASDCMTCTLPRALYDRIGDYAESRGATTFQVILALLYVYAARTTQREDVTIGIPVLNRSNAAFKNTFGQFAGISPVRMNLSMEFGFDHALRELGGVLKRDYRNQRFPISELNRVLGLRQAERSQMFDICLSYERHDHDVVMGTARGVSVAMLNGYQQTPLTLFVREFNRSDDIRLDFVFNTRYFDAAAIVTVHQRLRLLIDAILDESDTPLCRLPLLGQDELAQLAAWNDTGASYNVPEWVHQMFEVQAAAHGKAIAVISDERCVSYRELNEEANRLARNLVASGVRPNDPVAVCMPRCPQLPVAILAILKAGGSYVPLDPAYPTERIRHLLDDSAPAVVLVRSGIPDAARAAIQGSLASAASPARLVDMDLDAPAWQLQPVSNLAPADLPTPDESIAYIIYTSGSTGSPKGVANTVAGLRNRLAWFHEAVAEIPLVTAFKTSIGFVDSVTEILETLTCGGSLVVFDPDSTRDPLAFAQRVSQCGVTNLVLVPSLLKHLVTLDGAAFASVRTIMCSGERLAPDLVRAFSDLHRGIRLFNFYGSSEANGDSTAYEYTSLAMKTLDDGSIIGRPIANTHIYILDKWGQQVPPGVSGELYVSGVGVARAYLNQPERTAERFTADPFSSKPDVRMYRTGDLARFRPDGNIEYLGRNDFQVKIRGFRVEPSEVEKVIASHHCVKECVVVADAGGEDGYRLAAYVVPQATQDANTHDDDFQGFSLFYFGAETYDPDDKYRLYIESARYADKNDFHAVWTPERHFHEVGGLYPNPATLSAALATITHRIQLRSGSVVLPLQNPVRVAEEWSVVDNLSGGRVGVSVASGWVPRDFVLAPDNYLCRKEVMAAGIDTLKTLWRGEQLALPDGAGKSSSIRIYPKPVQRELPLWVTSSGNPATFAQAGALGANLLTHLLGQTIDEVAANIRVYRQARAEHGHDPKRGRVTLMVHTFLGPDFEQTLDRAKAPFTRYMRSHLGLLEAFAKGMDIPTGSLEEKNVDTIVNYAFERYSRTASLIGTPQTCLDVVSQLRDSGVNEIACLIDWMDAELALQALPYLNELRQLSQKAPPSADVMRKHLKRSLPQYMIPSSLTYLNQLPLTASGKLDRKALPKPGRVAVSHRYVAPRTPSETTLAQIYAQVLNLESVGIQDRFFDIGGDSLLAVKLNNAIGEAFRLTLPIRDLFEHATLEELAEHLDVLKAAKAPTRDRILPLVGQSRTPEAVVVRV